MSRLTELLLSCLLRLVVLFVFGVPTAVLVGLWVGMSVMMVHVWTGSAAIEQRHFVATFAWLMYPFITFHILPPLESFRRAWKIADQSDYGD